MPSDGKGSSVNVGSLDSGMVPIIEFEDPSLVRMKQRMRRSFLPEKIHHEVTGDQPIESEILRNSSDGKFLSPQGKVLDEQDDAPELSESIEAELEIANN